MRRFPQKALKLASTGQPFASWKALLFGGKESSLHVLIWTLPALFSAATEPATTDSIASPTDSLTVFRAPATVVHGQRRPSTKVDSLTWTRPSPLGTAGAVEALREQPGVSSEGEFSGKFSASGMPTEGSAVTWEGAQILWPWHFGGLFGNLDEWSTGSVDWHEPGDGSAPDQGGGWLETKSRAWPDSDGVHGGVRLGYVAGGLASWGRHGDWGWQFGYRRTWLDGALDLAQHEGWTDQNLAVRFQDANAAISWQHGPWKALVGWFGSEDTLGIQVDTSKNAFAWRNLAVPTRLSWQQGDWEAEVQASWSRYRRFDGDLDMQDTLGLTRLGGRLERHWDGGTAMELGLRADLWRTGHGTAWDSPKLDFTLRRRLEAFFPYLQLRQNFGKLSLQGWASLVHSQNDEAAPQAGLGIAWRDGNWMLKADAERKLVVLTQFDQSKFDLDLSPAWVILPGSSPRTTLFRLEAEHTTSFDALGNPARLRLGSIGWLRTFEDLWGWNIRSDRLAGRDEFLACRNHGWGSGLEIHGDLAWGRLNLSGRYALAANVLADTTAISRWAPWDQRQQGEARLSWRWKGTSRPAPGTFHWESALVVNASTGVSRTRFTSWSYTDSERDLNGPYTESGNYLRTTSRVPYLRVDLTPLELGRQGRWCAWWTLVNLTNETNLLGWSKFDDEDPAHAISQLPFLPVVFGAQVEF